VAATAAAATVVAATAAVVDTKIVAPATRTTKISLVTIDIKLEAQVADLKVPAAKAVVTRLRRDHKVVTKEANRAWPVRTKAKAVVPHLKVALQAVDVHKETNPAPCSWATSATWTNVQPQICLPVWVSSL